MRKGRAHIVDRSTKTCCRLNETTARGPVPARPLAQVVVALNCLGIFVGARTGPMGKNQKRSTVQKPVSQANRRQRQPGLRGPTRKPTLTGRQRAFLKYHRNSEGMTNQQLAQAMGRSKCWVRAVLNGTRGVDQHELETLATHVLPHQPFTDRYQDYSPWMKRTTGRGSGGEHVVGLDGREPPVASMPPKAAATLQPPVQNPRHVVGFDGLMFSGMARDQAAPIKFFPQLVRSGSDCYEFYLPTPSGSRLFTLSLAVDNHISPLKKARPGFQKIYNIGLVLDHLPVPQIVLVARLCVGATNSRCRSHRWIRGPHRSWGCLYHQQGKTCPSFHYHYHPRRCGQCDFSDRDLWICSDCARLNGEGCPECERLTREKSNLFIEVTGKGCQHQVHVPLVQHLFSRFVDPATVVRHACDIALDMDLPWANTLPVQDRELMTGNQRPFSTSRKVRNNDGKDPPGLYLGNRRVRGYGKHEEVRYRQDEDMDLTATLPSHMADWEHSTRLEFTFGAKFKSQPGLAGDLSNLPRDWSTFILADLSCLQPGTIEHELAWEAKLFGFTYHKASRKRVQGAFTRFENPKLGKRNPGSPYELMDAIDTWVHRQGKARYAEDNAQVLADVTMDTLRRVRHGFDVGQAVEAALPRLEGEIRDALTPPVGAHARALEMGRRTSRPPGSVTWQEKARDRQESRKIEEEMACRPGESLGHGLRQLLFDDPNHTSQ